MIKLTNKQQAVLEFIERYVTEHRCAPCIREIQAGCQIVSYKSTVDRLTALERKGFIRRRPNKHRSIRVVRPRYEPQQPPPELAPVGEGGI